MMQFEPTLIVKRLVVYRNTNRVFDELFHPGVNVIRGENSSGKSTVLNFLFYGLGGDLADWSAVALLCSSVSVEVSINGNSATLSRQISEQSGQPMELFGGDFEASERAPRTEWVRYPYKRSESKESFSQALFRLLGIPEVKSGEAAQNLTMHQILRLLYADQLSPLEDIFRFERFDPPLLRETIGRLLCGAYDNALYENEVEIRVRTREFDEVSAQLRTLLSVVGGSGQPLTMDWIEAERSVLLARQAELQTAIETAERDLFAGAKAVEVTLQAQHQAYDRLRSLQGQISEVRSQRDSIALTIADSDAFVQSLQRKLTALTDTSTVAQYLGEVKFAFCPSCYSPIDESDDHSKCHLCKTSFESAKASDRIVALINDTALQIKQSTYLQQKRRSELSKLDARLHDLTAEWNKAAEDLAALQRLPTTDGTSALRKLQREAGYLERQRENLEETAKIAQRVHDLSQTKGALNARITELRNENDVLKASQSTRLELAYSRIEAEILKLLHNDLRREEAFEAARSVQFEFGANRISVDGQSYFSASSRVILKSSFYLGFFAAANKNAFFRHPRFAIIDITEDKGMEVQRSHNFQLQIARVSQESAVDHQVIYATSMIAPELDDEAYTIGRYYTRDDHTIGIKMS
ncbi:AAA family ATPase [Mesorhizobium sp. C386A]|uniref:AAA family ATPase n=1 Tax=unclassified Mesorhizobium TaxID=325217 RepID=UPI0003CE8D34|nr:MULTISPECIES: AAA family ATPase [unclassified Mesorhizobium]ESY03934.1 hypothetical protein X752_27835 [Mesorhizobium sp. LNJC398B00]ESY38638.1 hypothetical protein X748_04070 [Mesorhizobium sp. LNJC386A00]